MGGLVAVFVGAGIGTGLFLIAVYVRGVDRSPGVPARRPHARLVRLRSGQVSGRIAAAVLVGALVLLLTHWLAAAAGVAVLMACWPALMGGARLEQQQIRRLEALVMWTESLRDTVTARASLEQAIPVTARTAPEIIRSPLIRLVGLLRARVPLDRALLALAEELDDPSADKVIGTLILNARRRGTGLGDVLTGLAASARAELDLRRQITAGRSATRRGVQLVVLITLAFGVFEVIFARDYLKPYDSAGGQLALAVVIGLFGGGFAWMRRLAGGETAQSFLARPDERVTERDTRTVQLLTGGIGTSAGQRTGLAALRGGVGQ